MRCQEIRRRRTYVLAICIVLLQSGTFVISKAAMNQGMNSYILTFYRQALASILLLSIALVSQRKNLSSLSPMLLLKLFVCALIGNTFYLNAFFISARLTSATIVSAINNCVPVFTFCIALLFRMETLKLRSSTGICKLAGIVLCIAGAIVIAFYAGPALRPVDHHHAFTHTSTLSNSSSRVAWIKGTFLMVINTMAWSLWLVMQSGVLKEYPNKMIVTVTQCVFSAVQCFFIAVVAERDFTNKWMLGFNVSLLAVIYGAFMMSGVAYLQVWCMEMRGPVFLGMWTPLTFVFTTFCSSFIMGEIVHIGSIVGGILVVGGLYSVLRAKSKELASNTSNGIQDEEDRHNIPQEEKETTSTSA